MNKLFFPMTLLATAMAFTACSEEDYITEVKGNPNNLVYLVQGPTVNTYNVQATPVGLYGDFNVQIPVRTTKAEQVTVTAVVAPELVEAYNEDKGTDYAAIPAAAVTFKEATVSTEKQQATISVVPDNDHLSLLEAGKTYLVPVTLTASNGGSVSEDHGVYYFVLSSTVKPNKNVNSIDDVVGRKITDYSGWTVTCGGAAQDASLIFGVDKADETIVPYGGKTCVIDQYEGNISLASSSSIIIDMQKNHKISAVAATNYYKVFSNRVVRKLFDDYHFEGSVDGKEWVDLGRSPWSFDSDNAAEDGYQYISLFGGFDCRYVRLTFSVNSSNVKNYNYVTAVRLFTTE